MTPTAITVTAPHSALPADPDFDPAHSTIFSGRVGSGKTYAAAEAASKFPDADVHVVSEVRWYGGWLHQGLHAASVTSKTDDMARAIANIWAVANVRDEEHRPDDQRRIILIVEEVGSVLDALSGPRARRSRETGEHAYDVRQMLLDLLIHGRPIDVTVYFTAQNLSRVPQQFLEQMQIVETVFPGRSRLLHEMPPLAERRNLAVS